MEKIPSLIQSEVFEDSRGILKFNNEFNASEIKRIYQIENNELHFVRVWQGHTIEQRWFSVFNGSFRFWVASVNDFTDNKLDQRAIEFILDEKLLAILHVPAGYLTAIQSLEKKSKLLVMSDYKKRKIE